MNGFEIMRHRYYNNHKIDCHLNVNIKKGTVCVDGMNT